MPVTYTIALSWPITIALERRGFKPTAHRGKCHSVRWNGITWTYDRNGAHAALRELWKLAYDDAEHNSLRRAALRRFRQLRAWCGFKLPKPLPLPRRAS